MEQITCPFCNFAFSNEFSYCPHCGKSVKDFAVSFGKQISLYLISVLLPPFGLIPGIKYLSRKDQKAKIVGLVAISLTILSCIITFWLTADFISQINNQVNMQVQQYENLGK